MMTAVASAARLETRLFNLNAYDRAPSLSDAEQAVLARVCSHRYQMVLAPEETALSRLLAPIVDVLRTAGFPDPTGARRIMLREMHRHQTAFWAWDEPVWSSILGSSGRNFQVSVTNESGVRIHLLVLAYQLCGLRRLHRRVGMVRLPQFADLVFGHGAVRAAVDEVNTTLVSWRTSKHRVAGHQRDIGPSAHLR
jgi:hypothetical protein